MDHNHKDDCSNCNCAHSTNKSVCQTLSEMDWERGLWYAAFNGEKERVQSLIDKSRIVKEAVNAPDNAGYTALHYAARRGHIDICRMLLYNGADVNAETKSGKASPLHKAAAAGKTAVIKFLVQSGACIKMQDIDGETALHKAAANNYEAATNVLLELCPQLAEIKDFKGQVPSIRPKS